MNLHAFTAVVAVTLLGSAAMLAGCTTQEKQPAPYALTGPERRPAFVQDPAGRLVPAPLAQQSAALDTR